MNYEHLREMALDSGFSYTAPLNTDTIELKQEVRDMCAQGCQQYAKRWSCPPGCGSLEELRGNIDFYNKGILVQTVAKLEDEFDWDGMMRRRVFIRNISLHSLKNSTPLILRFCHLEPAVA